MNDIILGEPAELEEVHTVTKAVVKTKPWYKSKVIWVNVLTTVIAILAMMMTTPELAPYVGWITLVSNTLTIILRSLDTDTRLTLR